jgi:hypothetical protein
METISHSLTHTREPESRACVCVPRREREIQHSTFRIAAHAEEKVNFLRRLLPTPPPIDPPTRLYKVKHQLCLIAKFVSLALWQLACCSVFNQSWSAQRSELYLYYTNFWWQTLSFVSGLIFNLLQSFYYPLLYFRNYLQLRRKVPKALISLSTFVLFHQT